MTLHVFNTLARRKEPFQSITPGSVKLYVCGPTVYDDPHLGHARCAVVFDVIRRYLQARGHRVTLVRNITDIDDKILKAADRRNRHFKAIAGHYTRRYQEAMQRLNVQAPDNEPRATEFMAQIQALISKLVQAGHAYAVGGDVYFATATFKPYGQLLGRDCGTPFVKKANAGAGKKRHPADFSLWKSARPREPFWPSPWGPGRPGWHIECSAMSAFLLGPEFDIHGGGEDLIFPHHENEIAQSAAAFGKTPARYWIHNGLIQVNGSKMSKSLANGLNLNDLLADHPPAALRLLALSKRYRHPLQYKADALIAAAKNAARLQRFFSQPPQVPDTCPPDPPVENSLWLRFCDSMDDDFNFPLALSVVFQSVRDVNRKLGGSLASEHCAPSESPLALKGTLHFICREILGLCF